MAARVSSHASSGSPPRLTSLVWTSARFTMLPAALLNISGVNFSEPGSRLSIASMADASRTILLMLGGLAAFGDEFVRQRHARFHILANAPLGALETALHGRDPQLVVFHAQDDFVAGLDSERLAKGGGDHDAAVLVDPHAGF